MNEKITIAQLYSNRISPLKRNVTTTVSPQGLTNQKPFAEVLQDKLVHISHHAEQRLEQRGIVLNSEQMSKIGDAIDRAAQKGAKDSLMLLNDVALIVNIKNKTVVTAMDAASTKDNVFTKIDSAVIIT